MTIRFWGTVIAVKPRLVLTKFAGETTAKCLGHLAVVEGTRSPADSSERPVGGRFTVALGPATQERRAVTVGDLLRGEAHPVPEGNPDTPADLYRVGVLRTIARAGESGGATLPKPDPPRTDLPLTSEQAEQAPRRPLHPLNLAEEGPCVTCPYGTIVPVVRLADPRDYRHGRWSQVPACLGPQDCPYYLAPTPQS